MIDVSAECPFAVSVDANVDDGWGVGDVFWLEEVLVAGGGDEDVCLAHVT